MATTHANAAAIRAFRIIEIMAQADQPLSLTDIVDRIELPKQTVHRLLKQLEGASLVTRTAPGRRYECSSRVRNMAVSMLMTAGPAAARRAILQELVQTVHETCNLSMPTGDDIVYLDRVEVSWPQRFVLSAGSRVPFHCTASGKLYLSFLPKQQRERLIKQLPLRGSTAHTITNIDDLRDELIEVRKNRYSINKGEFIPGMVAIAVPVMLDARRMCAAIAIQAPSERITTEQLIKHLPVLRRAADKAASTFR